MKLVSTLVAALLLGAAGLAQAAPLPQQDQPTAQGSSADQVQLLAGRKTTGGGGGKKA